MNGSSRFIFTAMCNAYKSSLLNMRNSLTHRSDCGICISRLKDTISIRCFLDARVYKKLTKLGKDPLSRFRGHGKLLFSAAIFGPNLFAFNKTRENSNSPTKILTAVEIVKKQYKKPHWIIQFIYFMYDLLRILLRALRMWITFTPIILLSPITYIGSGAQELWWKLLLRAVEFSGPILIKFGQWASTRRDIFPDVCCRHFSKLQRRTKPHSWYYTKLILRKSFGKNWRKIFVKFDNNKEPIGSGCVAQVYKVWINADELEDKEIISEIMQEGEEEAILHVSDGLEVLGFRKLFRTRKEDAEEEEEAMRIWRLKRDIKREELIKREKEKEKNGERESVKNSIQGISIGLAEDLVSHGSAHRDEYVVLSQHEEESDHILLDEWQKGADYVEKSLPVVEDHPDDLEGLIPVALKVLHPNIYRLFSRDMAIIRSCAAVISVLLPSLKWLSLRGCVEEFAQVMSAQLDMRTEAQNMEKFTEAFGDITFVRFPRPLRPFVSRSVLAETFEEGEPMINFVTDESNEAVRKNLAKIGVDLLLKMIFLDNFIHGDLHPGNIIVQNYNPAATKEHKNVSKPKLMMIDVGADIFVVDVQPDPKPLRICILDCGIVATLEQRDLENLTGVFRQVVLGKGESVADLFLQNSEHECRHPELFRTDMAALVKDARSNSVSLGQVDVGMLLQNVLSLLLKHHVRLESAFSAVVLAVFVLEGLGRSLDPDMDILERARPLLVTGLKNKLWTY